MDSLLNDLFDIVSLRKLPSEADMVGKPIYQVLKWFNKECVNPFGDMADLLLNLVSYFDTQPKSDTADMLSSALREAYKTCKEEIEQECEEGKPQPWTIPALLCLQENTDLGEGVAKEITAISIRCSRTATQGIEQLNAVANASCTWYIRWLRVYQSVEHMLPDTRKNFALTCADGVVQCFDSDKDLWYKYVHKSETRKVPSTKRTALAFFDVLRAWEQQESCRSKESLQDFLLPLLLVLDNKDIRPVVDLCRFLDCYVMSLAYQQLLHLKFANEDDDDETMGKLRKQQQAWLEAVKAR